MGSLFGRVSEQEAEDKKAYEASAEKLNGIIRQPGDFTIYVGLRRIHFLPYVEKKINCCFGLLKLDFLRIYNFFKNCLGIDSHSVHHYELVCWFGDAGGTLYGGYALSFDWSPHVGKSDNVDSACSLVLDRPGRLFKKQWNVTSEDTWNMNIYGQPVDEDVTNTLEENVIIMHKDYDYEYLFLGSSSKISNRGLFKCFEDIAAGYGTGVVTEGISGAINYTLYTRERAKCCYSYARLVAAKILGISDGEVDNRVCAADDTEGNRNVWVDFKKFQKTNFDMSLPDVSLSHNYSVSDRSSNSETSPLI